MSEIIYRAFVGGSIGEPFNPFSPEFMATGGTFPDGAIFMRYLNLNDNKGQRIYDADILEWHVVYKQNGYEPQKYVYRGVVNDYGHYTAIKAFWCDKESFDTVWIPKKARNIFFDAEVSWGRERTDAIEVIGNIYQNPELLK